MQINVFNLGIIFVFFAALCTYLYLSFFPAPYGRYYRKSWGVGVPSQIAWIVMESPSVLVFLAVYLSGSHRAQLVPLFLCFMWQSHYIYRSFIFPFRTKSKGKKMPLFVIMMGFIFNSLNAYLNASWISQFGSYTLSWIITPEFIIGASLFFVGYYIHYRSDVILFNLRKPNETTYKIPQGFLYRWTCCPNYLGEILTWIGFSIACWSLPGLAFAVFTIANLLPRAISHLHWYQNKFNEFPRDRKALIPYLL